MLNSQISQLSLKENRRLKIHFEFLLGRSKDFSRNTIKTSYQMPQEYNALTEENIELANTGKNISNQFMKKVLKINIHVHQHL